MLTLGRKVKQRIMIGEDIVLTVSQVRGNKVWLTFEAPGGVRIDRKEIRREKQEQAAREALSRSEGT